MVLRSGRIDDSSGPRRPRSTTGTEALGGAVARREEHRVGNR
jgi:hypothetical protein